MKFYEKILLELESEEHSMRTVYRHAFAFSDETAFEYSVGTAIRKVTYSACRKEILRICGLVKEHAVQGQIVALIMKNSPLWVECFWAILMAGCKVMPLSEDMTDSMLAGCIKDSGCRFILGDRKAEDCTNIEISRLEKELPSEAPADEPESGWGDEIILSTSATTGEPVLYSYTGRQICAQILNSGYVLQHCKDVSRFWKGQFRLLAFLPFCHIFGLTACYLWFTLFGRTFVFLNDYAPSTILNTCRTHKVTHIFAIPLLWDMLAKGITAEAEKTGQTAKLEKGISLSLKLQDNFPHLARSIVPKIMKSVRDKTLGPAVQFCISGGGACGKDTGRIVNGCGYHLENGYGMTEIGIACVTLHKKASRRDCTTVGRLFPSLEAKIDNEGQLLIKGDSCYEASYKDGVRILRNKDEWISTGDSFAMADDGELTIIGRTDDLINGANGERISLEAVETELKMSLTCCAIGLKQKGLTLLVQVPSDAKFSFAKKEAAVKETEEALNGLNTGLRPGHVLYTYEDIPVSLSHKYRRKYIAEIIEEGSFKVFTKDEFLPPAGIKARDGEQEELALEIASIMKEVLKKEDVSVNSSFFSDLGGDSLRYIEFLNTIETRFGITIPRELALRFANPVSAAEIIKEVINRNNEGT